MQTPSSEVGLPGRLSIPTLPWPSSESHQAPPDPSCLDLDHNGLNSFLAFPLQKGFPTTSMVTGCPWGSCWAPTSSSASRGSTPSWKRLVIPLLLQQIGSHSPDHQCGVSICLVMVSLIILQQPRHWQELRPLKSPAQQLPLRWQARHAKSLQALSAWCLLQTLLPHLHPHRPHSWRAQRPCPSRTASLSWAIKLSSLSSTVSSSRSCRHPTLQLSFGLVTCGNSWKKRTETSFPSSVKLSFVLVAWAKFIGVLASWSC